MPLSKYAKQSLPHFLRTPKIQARTFSSNGLLGKKFGKDTKVIWMVGDKEGLKMLRRLPRNQTTRFYAKGFGNFEVNKSPKKPKKPKKKSSGKKKEEPKKAADSKKQVKKTGEKVPKKQTTKRTISSQSLTGTKETDTVEDKKPKMPKESKKDRKERLKHERAEKLKKEKEKEEEGKKDNTGPEQTQEVIENMDRLFNFMLVGLVVFSTVIVVNVVFNHQQKKTLEEFEEDYKSGKVEKIVIHDQIIQIHLFQAFGGSYYEVVYDSENFEAKLKQLEAEVDPDQKNPVPVYFGSEKFRTAESNIISATSGTLSVAITLFIIMMILRGISQLGAAGGPGGMANRMIGNFRGTKEAPKSEVFFKDVAGLEEAKVEIEEFVEFLKAPKKFHKIGARIPTGALLTGPPGTGKTLLAKAVAGEADVPFYQMSGSEFVEVIVGVGPQRVRELFENARKNSPSIVFIDEIDAIGKKRNQGGRGGNDERENTLNQLLVEMDGVESSTNVVVLAATNRPDTLDAALKRPGRLDRQIEITNPDIKGREEIFMVHLGKLTLLKNKKFYAQRLAALTPGFSGADIANVCNEAAIIAARASDDKIYMEHFVEAIDKVIGGMEKKNRVIPKKEREIVAHHEAGHAVVGWFLENCDPLLKVSIVPRGPSALGYAQYLPKENAVTTMDELFDRMCMTLGGRAAEDIMYNHLSSGAQNDLRKVTQMAYQAITVYGMSDKVGHVSFPTDDEYSVHKPFSEKTAQLIDDEVKELVERAYETSKNLLLEQKEGMVKVAETLLENEKIDADDMVDILGPHKNKEGLKSYLSAKTTLAQEREEMEAYRARVQDEEEEWDFNEEGEEEFIEGEFEEDEMEIDTKEKKEKDEL